MRKTLCIFAILFFARVSWGTENFSSTGMMELENEDYKISLYLTNDVKWAIKSWATPGEVVLLRYQNKAKLNETLTPVIMVFPKKKNETNADLTYSLQIKQLNKMEYPLEKNITLLKGKLTRNKLSIAQSMRDITFDVPEDVGKYQLFFVFYSHGEQIFDGVLEFEVFAP